jgi:hypothetical protein
VVFGMSSFGAVDLTSEWGDLPHATRSRSGVLPSRRHVPVGPPRPAASARSSLSAANPAQQQPSRCSPHNPETSPTVRSRRSPAMIVATRLPHEFSSGARRSIGESTTEWLCRSPRLRHAECQS